MGRRLVVEADGGSRGNPGVAGYGALVRDAESGALLAERADPLGQASNNVAEYRGLIAGLTAAEEIDPAATIEARLDSKLVVEQMSGRWKIKHEDMRRLALQAREVVARIVAAGGSVSLTWIPRAENAAADRLSNIAMDGDRVHRDPWRGAPAAAAPADAPVGSAPPDREDGFAHQQRRMRGEPTRIILVRHGVTPFTQAGRLDGRGGSDPELSALGWSQARAAGSAVARLLDGSPARVVTSSLTRARQTGGAVAQALGVDHSIDADFDEQGFGDWDGVALSQLLAEQAEEFTLMRTDPSYGRPGGESHEQLSERVLSAFERVVRTGGTTVVASHRKPIMVILGEVLGLSHEGAWRLATDPGSLSAVEIWPDGGTSVAFTNRT